MNISFEKTILQLVDAGREASISHFVLGLSGGMDSMVLLYLLHRYLPPAFSFEACYVHHGLQVEADDWACFCRQQCEARQIPFRVIQVKVEQVKRKGIEAVARKARYDALLQVVGTSEAALVTAHHQRDQAETVLLNLGRGTGIAGLAGMPYCKTWLKADGVKALQFRPLLNVSYADLQAYAVEQKLDWVEDPSNQNLDFRRNRIRHQVLPEFDQAWSNAQQNIALTAERVAESLALMDDLAQLDLANLDLSSFYLEIPSLPAARQKNCVRYWAQQFAQLPLSARIYDWVLQMSFKSSSRKLPEMQLSQGRLFFFNHTLFYFSALEMRYQCSVADFDVAHRQFYRQGFMQLALNDLPSGAKWVRNVTSEDALNRKALKKFWQQNKVPPWDRQRWPVILDSKGQILQVLGFKGEIHC